jgi:glycine C-acetyltransferase
MAGRALVGRSQRGALVDREFLSRLSRDLEELKTTGLYKAERVITSPQGAVITVQGGREVINFCANNYLGLSNHPLLVEAARDASRTHGFGLSSVRFICGTQDIHKELEATLSRFVSMEDTILYSSCFDANGGLFETILGEEDAVISDALNHASIIDGVRLSKAQRFRYANNDMADLRARLEEAKGCRTKLIATDGVFSMDGTLANLPAICDLADSYGALVMVDDSHAVGFIGAEGGGTPEQLGVRGRIDILTGTLGKALGGASGGYTSGKKEIIEWLRQRSRPYLFSNTLAPAITKTALVALEMLSTSEGTTLREKLRENGLRFRAGMEELGFTLVPGQHPIIPVMLGDATLATTMANRLLDHGIYVIGFSFPVVPRGQARIRTQMSAAHDKEHIDRALQAFAVVGRELGVIS